MPIIWGIRKGPAAAVEGNRLMSKAGIWECGDVIIVPSAVLFFTRETGCDCAIGLKLNDEEDEGCGGWQTILPLAKSLLLLPGITWRPWGWIVGKDCCLNRAATISSLLWEAMWLLRLVTRPPQTGHSFMPSMVWPSASLEISWTPRSGITTYH